MSADRFQIISPHDLEDYRDQAGNLSDVCWPEFMLHDRIANQNWHELFDRFEEYQFAMLDTATNRMAAMGNSLPFYWDQPLEELPELGWDLSSSKRLKIIRMALPPIFKLPFKSRFIPIIKARDSA